MELTFDLDWSALDDTYLFVMGTLLVAGLFLTWALIRA